MSADSIEEIEARRAERKARNAAEERTQYAADLEALDALEVEHGDTNVASVRVPFSPGLPTLVVVRCPHPPEVKRYRARVTPSRDGEKPDYVGPAEELAAVCLRYPDRETYERMCLARPGIGPQVGLEALKLASGKAESEGKG